MKKAKIKEAYDDTFSGLKMYYRDCELSQNFITKYSINQIIMEKGFTDVSSFAEGLGKNLRYAIASNKAANMGQINSSVAKYGFHLITSNSFFKVLDIYRIGDTTQILLLHFDAKHLKVFKKTTSNMEEKVIGMGRESFDQKILLEPNPILNDEQWSKRTQFPIGMSDNGYFFTPIIKRGEKKGFWKRLFG